MIDREKLSELAQEANEEITKRIELDELTDAKTAWLAFADYLIEHGATFKDVPDTNVVEWISVKDRLPEKQADVLIFFGGKYGNMATGFWHGEEKEDCIWWCAYTDDGFYTDCDYKPTHWMPLPQPPEEEREEK